MLKIKDNVDLKELERFGFEYIVEKYKRYTYKNKFIKIDVFLDLENECENKVLFMITNEYNRNYANLDVLYDLIKADLVDEV